MEPVMFVRLKPFNPKIGHHVQRYHYKRQLYQQDQSTSRPIWYKVDGRLAADLVQHKQNPNDPLSQPLFDIVSPSEHSKIMSEEEKLRLVELGITTATQVKPVPKAPIDLVAKAQAEGRSAAVPEPEVMVTDPVSDLDPLPEPMSLADDDEAESDMDDDEPPADTQKSKPRGRRNKPRYTE